MLEHRAIKLAVVVWWLASIAWLVGTKLILWSSLHTVPTQRFHAVGNSQPSKVTWDIDYRSKPVGTSVTEIRPQKSGLIVTSLLTLQQLPIREMMQETSALLPWLAQASGVRPQDMSMALTVSTRMELDPFGEFERLESSVRVDELGELFVARIVRLSAEQLDLIVVPGKNLPQPWSSQGELVRQPINLPKNAIVSDMFAPVPMIEQLHVGQEWTVQSYRPFPPNRPLHLLAARVDREEIIPWEGDAEPMLVVTLRELDPVLSALAEPRIELWVRHGGMVVKQRLRMGNLQIDFVRREEARDRP